MHWAQSTKKVQKLKYYKRNKTGARHQNLTWYLSRKVYIIRISTGKLESNQTAVSNKREK